MEVLQQAFSGGLVLLDSRHRVAHVDALLEEVGNETEDESHDDRHDEQCDGSLHDGEADVLAALKPSPVESAGQRRPPQLGTKGAEVSSHPTVTGIVEVEGELQLDITLVPVQTPDGVIHT